MIKISERVEKAGFSHDTEGYADRAADRGEREVEGFRPFCRRASWNGARTITNATARPRCLPRWSWAPTE